MRVKNLKQGIYSRLSRIGIPLLVLALFAFAFPQNAEAGFCGGRSHFGFHRGFYGDRLGFHRPFGSLLGFHPSRAFYSPRLFLPYARVADLGALDLDIKPKKAEVYLDGRYVGLTREFDGSPDFLWLKEGSHQLVFYKEGFGTVEREYTIHPGEVFRVQFRLEEGESIPPQELAADPAEGM